MVLYDHYGITNDIENCNPERRLQPLYRTVNLIGGIVCIENNCNQ